jgi:formylglycine-generating enzyme required for sulfatase activity
MATFSWIDMIVPMIAVASLSSCASPTADQVRSGAEAFRDCPDCPELVHVAPGEFLMGSTEAEAAGAGMRADRAATERPQHAVEIRYPFAIGRFEVTVAEFGVYARETGFNGNGCFGLADGTWQLNPAASWASPGYPATPRHAATCLSPDDFQGYLNWLSQKTGKRYRFPSEAEWEYAARSGAGGATVWSPGDPAACKAFNAADASYRAAFDQDYPSFDCDDGHAVTAPVGSYAANRLGMHDVQGNVAEFVADCFFASHDGAPIDGSARRDDPRCMARVAKGGSWAGEPGFMRPAVRVVVTADVRGTGFGMRVLREP